jgi:hypothetical protein
MRGSFERLNLRNQAKTEPDQPRSRYLVGMNNSTLTLLLSLAFLGIGFAIGRVTAPHPHGACKHKESHRSCRSVESDDLEVIVANVTAGDTVIAIPGGEITWVQEGEEVRVNVEIEEEGEGRRVIERRVIVDADH